MVSQSGATLLQQDKQADYEINKSDEGQIEANPLLRPRTDLEIRVVKRSSDTVDLLEYQVLMLYCITGLPADSLMVEVAIQFFYQVDPLVFERQDSVHVFAFINEIDGPYVVTRLNIQSNR